MAENSVEDLSYALTTIDNPYHPVDEYDQWVRYDEEHGYFTNSYLARVAKTSPYLTEVENQRIVNEAIDDIIRLDFTSRYTKVLVDEEDVI